MAQIRGLIDSGSLSETVGAFLVDETKSFEVEIGVPNLCLCGSGSFSSVEETHEDECAEAAKPGYP
jgi:hypothetical protein